MTYDAIETSAAAARPVEIYTFARGTQEWLYTSSDATQEISAKTYTAATIRRPSIRQGMEMNQAAMKLLVPRNFPIAVLFQTGVPADTITLRIQQFHEGDGELVAIWSGRVLNVAMVDDGAEIVCEPIYTSARQVGLRRRYQRQCPHTLYGPACGVDPDSYVLTAAVSAISGLTVTAAALAGQADGWWEGGWLRWEISPGIYERRFILGHTGSTLTLLTQPLGLEVDDLVDFFPGCDHSTGAGGCARFGNIPNYGGFIDIPTKNPYGADPIY